MGNQAKPQKMKIKGQRKQAHHLENRKPSGATDQEMLVSRAAPWLLAV